MVYDSLSGLFVYLSLYFVYGGVVVVEVVVVMYSCHLVSSSG